MQAGLQQAVNLGLLMCGSHPPTCLLADLFNVYTLAVIDSTIAVHTHTEILHQLPADQ
jgi:hypothetical protein